MTTTLVLDTSAAVSVGVLGDGRIVASGRVDDTRAHAEELAPLVQRTLAEAQVALAEVRRIVVGVGPGPFTGLRVAIVTAATLGEVLGVEVTGACSLDAVAAAWADADAPAEFVVVSDARRREVYWARYDATGTRLDGPHVTPPADVPALPLAGPGAHLVGDPSGPTTLDAGWLAVGVVRPEGLEPLYLRRPDAEVPTRVKSALPVPRVSLGGTR